MKAISRLLADLAGQMVRVQESADEEAVHDLRVATRRLGEGLRLFAGELPDGAGKRVRREIRELRQRAAAVRDRDVTLGLLRRKRLPAGDPAYAYLRGQRDLAAEELRAFVRRRLQKRRPERWAERLGVEL